MKNTPRVPRDFAGMKRRRLKAGRMYADGKTQADVVHRLKVSRQTASRWHSEWEKGGQPALEGSGRVGRKSRLDKSQIREIDRQLRHGPKSHGYHTELWTLKRIAAVIKKTTGVKYHHRHVWRILRQLNWSVQRPAKKAIERNEAAIRGWVSKTWPGVKKKRGEKNPG